jgi:hypothetical protein
MAQLELPREVLRKAKKCEKAYACLSCDLDELCKIKYTPATKDGTHFIECSKHPGCVFLEIYELSNMVICNCPVRKEIYQCYKR